MESDDGSSCSSIHTSRKSVYTMVSDNDGSSCSSSYSTVANEFDDPVTLACDLCNKTFDHESTLRRHRKDHEASKCRGIDNEEYICPICHKLYYFIRQYNAHIQKYHEDSSEMAPLGSVGHQKFADANSLKNHSSSRNKNQNVQEEITTRPVFDCNHCNRRFDSKLGVTTHLKSHRHLLYRCKVCSEAFSSKAMLSKHETKKSHLRREREMSKKRLAKKKTLSFGKQSNVQNEQSPSVGMSIDEENSVDKIPANKSASSTDQMVCKEPNLPEISQPTNAFESVGANAGAQRNWISISNIFTLGNNQGKSSSMDIIDVDEIPVDETDTKNFSCGKCTKTFYTKEELEIHLNNHSEPQMHQCSLCDFCSQNQFAFALHVLDHYKKHYTCDICNRSFYTKTTMEFHALTHEIVN